MTYNSYEEGVVKMAKTKIYNEIINDLEKLPIDLQIKVKDFVAALILTLPKGIDGQEILNFAGIFDKNDLDEMEEIINEGCERIDKDEW